MLDAAGMEDCKIIVSNSLDEYTIQSLLTRQEAKIDSFGVGERMTKKAAAESRVEVRTSPPRPDQDSSDEAARKNGNPSASFASALSH